MDNRALRSALGSFVTGVTVITTHDAEGIDYGITANSFNSVSLDPPLVLWSLSKTSSSLPAFTAAAQFAIHILASDQVDLSARFAQRGADKFAGLDFDRGDDGVPLLQGCSARFVCRPAYAYEGGDHVIFVGEVLEFEHGQASPLAFHGGGYALTANHAPGADADPGHLTHLIQSCYFHLLTPVREERERRSIGLTDHYILNALFARPGLDLEGINAIIAYTGVRAEAGHTASLIERGLISTVAAQEAPGYALTERGRDAVVSLMGATVVREMDLGNAVSQGDLRLLSNLLSDFLRTVAKDSPEPVHQHMALLREIQFGER